MKVPQEIADKVKVFNEAMEVADKAYDEVTAWLRANTGADCVSIEDLFITNTPTGTEQNDGEYCDQTAVGWSGDSFSGCYYHPIEGSDKYLGYSYEC